MVENFDKVKNVITGLVHTFDNACYWVDTTLLGKVRKSYIFFSGVLATLLVWIF